MSSEESKVYLPQVVGQLKEKGKEIRVIDLRKSFVLKGEERYHYIEQINEACRSAVVNGEILILSLDDSEEADFEEIFYPEIKELYTSNGFNSCFWAPQDLSKVEIRSKIIGEAVVHDNFQFLVWSKVKIRQVISDDFIMEKLQKRFESVIPFIKIDIIFAEESKEKGA